MLLRESPPIVAEKQVWAKSMVKKLCVSTDVPPGNAKDVWLKWHLTMLFHPNIAPQEFNLKKLKQD